MADPTLSIPPLAADALLGRSLTGRGPADGPNGELARTARDFETVLLHRLVQAMKNSIPDSALVSSGVGKQVEGLFWHYLAEEMGRQGGFGLWKDLCRRFAEEMPEAGDNSTVETVR